MLKNEYRKMDLKVNTTLIHYTYNFYIFGV